MYRRQWISTFAIFVSALVCAPALAGTPKEAPSAVVGVVDSVDYGQGTIVVRRGHERISVAVVPSTQIYVRNDAGTFADVHPGMHVQIFVSQVGSGLVAQIVRLH